MTAPPRSELRTSLGGGGAVRWGGGEVGERHWEERTKKEVGAGKKEERNLAG